MTPIGFVCLLIGIFGWWLESEKIVPRGWLSIIIIIGLLGLFIVLFEAIFGRRK